MNVYVGIRGFNQHFMVNGITFNTNCLFILVKGLKDTFPNNLQSHGFKSTGSCHANVAML